MTSQEEKSCHEQIQENENDRQELSQGLDYDEPQIFSNIGILEKSDATEMEYSA